METVKITKIYSGNAVWVDKDILAMPTSLQSLKRPAASRSCVTTVRYNYPWLTSTRNRVCEVARMFGAGENVEFRFRDPPVIS